LRACGGAEEAPDHSDVGGQVPSEGLRGLAPIGGDADGACGEGRRDRVDEAAGQGAAGARGHLEGLGEGGFARPCKTQRQAQGGTRPARQGDTPAGPDEGEAPPRALCVAGSPGTVAGVIGTLHRPPVLFHDGIISADGHAGLRRDERGATADAPGPALRATRAKRPASQGIIPRAMLHLGCATMPQRRREGLSATGEGPPVGQGGAIVPGGGAEHSTP
jgi:hypothetical protein